MLCVIYLIMLLVMGIGAPRGKILSTPPEFPKTNVSIQYGNEIGRPFQKFSPILWGILVYDDVFVRNETTRPVAGLSLRRGRSEIANGVC